MNTEGFRKIGQIWHRRRPVTGSDRSFLYQAKKFRRNEIILGQKPSNRCKLTKKAPACVDAKERGDLVKQLVIRAQAGDADAFVQLVEARRQQLYKIAFCYLGNREDVADAIQDTILAAFERIGDLKQPQYFHTWLVRILINRCKDDLKRRAREVVTEVMPDAETGDPVLERLMYQELLQQIDPKYRDVLILHYVDGFRTREIAKILDMKQGTVLTWLRKGRQQLEAIYELNNQYERTVYGNDRQKNHGFI